MWPASLALTVAQVLTGCAPAATSNTAASAQPDLGSGVYVFSPRLPQSRVQATVNAIARRQAHNQFGTQRYALLFEPGTYGSVRDPLFLEVGYYTSVAGLGASRGSVVINGAIDSFNQCSSPATSNCSALNNFWRSLSNLTINVPSSRRGGSCQQTAGLITS